MFIKSCHLLYNLLNNTGMKIILQPDDVNVFLHPGRVTKELYILFNRHFNTAYNHQHGFSLL